MNRAPVKFLRINPGNTTGPVVYKMAGWIWWRLLHFRCLLDAVADDQAVLALTDSQSNKQVTTAPSNVIKAGSNVAVCYGINLPACGPEEVGASGKTGYALSDSNQCAPLAKVSMQGDGFIALNLNADTGASEIWLTVEGARVGDVATLRERV